jgi:hypothetical protein
MSTTGHSALVAVPVTGELLGDRTVVRLAAEPLIPVVGQTVAHLGLTAGAPTTVGTTTARAVGFPEWPILQDPELTGHALSLADDLDWVRKNVRKGVQKAEFRISAIIDREVGTHPELLPTLLEEFSRILDDAGRDAAAKRWFSQARSLETDYSLPVDPDRHRTVFLEFAERGVVGAKDLTAESKAAVARAGEDPDALTAAYTYVLDLNAERLRGGNPPYSALLADLIRAGKAAGKKPDAVAAEFIGLVKDTPGLDKAEMPFRAAAAKKLKKHPDLLAALFGTFREPSGYGHATDKDVDAFFVNARSSGLMDALLKEGPADFLDWLVGVLEKTGSLVSGTLLNFVHLHASRLRGATVRIDLSDVALPVIDSLERAGVAWEITGHGTTSLHNLAWGLHWRHNPQHSGHVPAGGPAPVVDAVAANPDLVEALVRDFRAAQGAALLKPLVTYSNSALARAVTPHLITALITELADGDTGVTVPHLAALRDTARLILAADPPVEDLRRLAEAFTLSAPDILAANLRLGLLQEYTWPELETHIDRWDATLGNGGKGPALQLRESFPGVIARVGDELVAVEGEETLAVTHGQVGEYPLLRAGYFRDEDGTDGTVRVLAVTEKGGITWDDGSTVACSVPRFPEWTEGLSIPVTGGRLYGTGVIATGATQATWPVGVVESTGDRTWRATSDYDAPRPEKVDPFTGQDTGPVAWSAIPTIRLQKAASPRSWSMGVTTGNTWCFLCADSDILPVHDGVVCVAQTSPSDAKVVAGDGRGHVRQTWVAPSTGQGGERWFPLHLNGRTVMLGNHRHLRWSGDRRYTAAEPTPSLDARGNATWQILLPYPAWANMRVRSQDASAVLRTMTAAAVRPLLDALSGDPGMALPTLDHLQLDNRKVIGVHHDHRPVDARCEPGSPAMVAAASLIGTDDPALCAGVVQTAALVIHEVASAGKLVAEIRRTESKVVPDPETNPETAVGPEVCADKSGDPCQHTAQKSAQNPRTPGPAEVVEVRRQMQELDDLMTGTPGDRYSTWRWPFTVGFEKASVVWARGPFVTDAERSAVACVLRSIAETVDTDRWRRTAVDWSRITVQATKTRSGGEAWDNPDDKDNSTHLIILGKADVPGAGNASVNHVLADLPDNGAVPTALLGSPLCGAPELCRDLGIDPALTGDDLLAAADRLDAITVGTQNAPSPDSQLVTLLTTHLPLTPTAATMLLAGAYHPHHTVIPLDHNKNETTESQKYRRAAAKTLGMTGTAVAAALTLLQALDPELLLTLLAASFDGIGAVEKVLEPRQPLAISLTDRVADVVDISSVHHNSGLHDLRCITRPLTTADVTVDAGEDPRFILSTVRNSLGVVLCLARDLEAATADAQAQAGHLADQLDVLVTAADPESDKTWRSDIELPFSGQVQDSPHTRKILNHVDAPLRRAQRPDDLPVGTVDDQEHAVMVDAADPAEPLVLPGAGHHGGDERVDMGHVAGDRVRRADTVAAVGAGDPTVVERQLSAAARDQVDPASGERGVRKLRQRGQ